MSTVRVDIIDYEDSKELLQDPTDPNEVVEREFMNQIGKLITHAEEMSQNGSDEFDMEVFIRARGNFLDLFGEDSIVMWLERMRSVQRIPFRRYEIRG